MANSHAAAIASGFQTVSCKGLTPQPSISCRKQPVWGLERALCVPHFCPDLQPPSKLGTDSCKPAVEARLLLTQGPQVCT